MTVTALGWHQQLGGCKPHSDIWPTALPALNVYNTTPHYRDRGVPTCNDSTVPVRGSVSLPYFLTSTDFLFELPDFPFKDVSSLSRSFEIKLHRELFQLKTEFSCYVILEFFIDLFSMFRLADA